MKNDVDPGPPINKNIFAMSHRERRHLRIDELPGNLSEALDELEKDALMRELLGDHLFEHFVAAKREEWLDYIKHVSPWEVDRYSGDVLSGEGQPRRSAPESGRLQGVCARSQRAHSKKVSARLPAQDGERALPAFSRVFSRNIPGMRFDGLSGGRVGINGVRNFRQALASPHPVEVSRFGAATFEIGARL